MEFGLGWAVGARGRWNVDIEIGKRREKISSDPFQSFSPRRRTKPIREIIGPVTINVSKHLVSDLLIKTQEFARRVLSIGETVLNPDNEV